MILVNVMGGLENVKVFKKNAGVPLPPYIVCFDPKTVDDGNGKQRSWRNNTAFASSNYKGVPVISDRKIVYEIQSRQAGGTS